MKCRSIFLGKPFTLGSDKTPFGPIQSLQSFCLDICAARNVKYTKPKWTVINRIHKINKTCLGCNLHSWAVEFYSAIVLSSFLKEDPETFSNHNEFFLHMPKKIVLTQTESYIIENKCILSSSWYIDLRGESMHLESVWKSYKDLLPIKLLRHGRTKICLKCARCVAEGGIGAVAGESWVPGCGEDGQPKPPVSGQGGHQTGF